MKCLYDKGREGIDRQSDDGNHQHAGGLLHVLACKQSILTKHAQNGLRQQTQADRSRQGHRKGQPESSGEMFFESFCIGLSGTSCQLGEEHRGQGHGENAQGQFDQTGGKKKIRQSSLIIE